MRRALDYDIMYLAILYGGLTMSKDKILKLSVTCGKEKKDFDLLMYVGHLPRGIHKTGLIRIPRRFEPKHFYMTGKVYEKSLDSQSIYCIENWDVNLSDYDII